VSDSFGAFSCHKLSRPAHAGLCPSVPSAGPVRPSSALACELAARREQVAMLVEKNALLEEQVRRL